MNHSSLLLPSLPPLQNGEKVKNGQYEIIGSTINAGGFGRIYKAYGSRFNKDGSRHVVALKEFYVNEFQNNNFRTISLGAYSRTFDERDLEMWQSMFRKEAMIMVRLNDQNDRHVPIVHNVWKNEVVFEENGRMFYAMTFIDGPTLTDVVKERGCLKEDEALGYIIQIAKVLYKAHQWNLIHCDISPNNIMLEGKFAVLVDFGNAISYDYEWLKQQSGGNSAFTGLNNLSGTPGFSPVLDLIGTQQGDIYSLAATLFYLLTGAKPGVLYTERSCQRVVEKLKEKGISEDTVRAIMAALLPEDNGEKMDARRFLHMLPYELVIDSLLNYNDHDYDKR